MMTDSDLVKMTVKKTDFGKGPVTGKTMASDLATAMEKARASTMN